MDADTLPSPVRDALERHGADAVVGALRTAGSWPVGGFGAAQVLAPLWVVVTARRVWVVAADEAGAFVEATGARDGLRVERGWVTDTVHAASFSLALAARTRREAEALAATWATQPGMGTEVRLPTPGALSGSGSGRVARAARGLPDWLQATVPVEPGTTWLYALRTATTHAFGRRDGVPRAVPVWVLVADSVAMLAAYDVSGLAHVRLDDPLQLRDTATRSYLGDGAHEVALELGGAGRGEVVRRLASGPADRRWAVLGEYRAEQGRLVIASRVWREAIALDRGRSSWPGIARAAWTVSQSQLALRALVHCLEQDIMTPSDRAAWSAPIAARESVIRDRHGAAAAVVSVLSEAMGASEVAPPPSLPWPPADDLELWVCALGALQRWTAALDLARGLPESARASEIRAVLTEHRGDDPTRAWREAARAWRTDVEHEAARRCLTRALDGEVVAADVWRLGAWCWQDGQPGSARTAWNQGCSLDPEGASLDADASMEPDGWRALGALAEGHDAAGVARLAWSRVVDAGPADVSAGLALARLVDLDPEGTAVQLEGIARAAEADGGVGAALAALWVAVAERRHGDARQQALARALDADTLGASSWSTVLDLAEPTDRPWWWHVARVVTGTGEPGAPAVRRLPDDSGALAPEAADWLGAMRRVLDVAEPVDDRALVRGLDRVPPDVLTLVREVANTLGVPEPDARVFGGDDAYGVAAHTTDTAPVLRVGRDHVVEGPRRLAPASLRFAVAVELAHVAAGHPALGRAGVVGTSRSAYAALGKYANTAENVVELLSLVPGVDQAAKVQKLLRLGRQVSVTRGAIDRAGALASPLLDRVLGGAHDDQAGALVHDLADQAALRLRRHADRIALVATGDLAAAVDAVLAMSARPELRDRVTTEGLAAVLGDPKAGLSAPTLVRLGELARFAAVEMVGLPAA